MKTIVVINTKGGCGKTTVSTNLASYYAAHKKTAILDYDPQGSSLHWLAARPQSAPKIHGGNGSQQRGSQLRSWQMAIPEETERLIIDAPAGTSGLLFQELVRRADYIVIPVAPTSIDIHATAGFVRDLLLVGRIRNRNVKVAVVANRVRRSMPVYEPLERFLSALGLAIVTQMRDSDQFIIAAEHGLGVFEMDAAEEQYQLLPLLRWLDDESFELKETPERSAQNRVIPFPFTQRQKI